MFAKYLNWLYLQLTSKRFRKQKISKNSSYRAQSLGDMVEKMSKSVYVNKIAGDIKKPPIPYCSARSATVSLITDK